MDVDNFECVTNAAAPCSTNGPLIAAVTNGLARPRHRVRDSPAPPLRAHRLVCATGGEYGICVATGFVGQMMWCPQIREKNCAKLYMLENCEHWKCLAACPFAASTQMESISARIKWIFLGGGGFAKSRSSTFSEHGNSSK